MRKKKLSKEDNKIESNEKEVNEKTTVEEIPLSTTDESDATLENEVTEKESDVATDLDLLRKEAEENHGKYLRIAAELENVRRRNEKLLDDTRKYVLTSFSSAICEVRDCLETALETSKDDASVREGVSLTLRKLVSAMDDFHISPLCPDIGASFDPNLHMAIGTAPATKERPPETIATVVQTGYMLHGRVIRAAKVIVTQGEEKKE